MLMWVVHECQTFLLILEKVEVPKDLLKAWSVTEQLWHRNQMLEETPIAWHLRSTTIGLASRRELRR